jgi:hypothetical protein
MWTTEKDKKGHGPLDYHQNVDSDYFENWFTALCATVQRKYHGQATYLIDGAKSHIRRKDLPPTQGNMTKMRDFLQRHGVPATEWEHMKQVKEGGRKAPPGGWKKPLQAVIKKHGHKSLYETVKIAVRHGARVRYTPPYTPELQPIERCWGNAKDPIGRRPARTMTELKQRMREGFDAQGMALF